MQEVNDLYCGSGLAPTLESLGDDPRVSLERLASLGFRFVQLSATQAGLRPRDLDNSARRDLAVKLRRWEIAPSGIDLWIPPAHFVETSNVDRAVDATKAAIELASDLDRCPVSMEFPSASDDDEVELQAVIAAIAEHAARFGIQLADHAVPVSNWQYIGIGIDPAAWLSNNSDPAKAIHKNAQQIVSIRLCDLLTSGMRAPICQSQGAQLDIVQYQVAISVNGYLKPMVIDARQWQDPWTGIAQTANSWLTLTSQHLS